MMTNRFIVRILSQSARRDATAYPAPTSDSSPLCIEMVTEIVKVNMDHARHIEAQRMLLAIGYGVAMYSLLPSALKHKSDDWTSMTVYSLIGLVVTILAWAMTHKWNEAFTRWIKAAEAVTTSMKSSRFIADDAGKLRVLFGFKDRQNPAASDAKKRRFVDDIRASRMFTMLYGGAATIWLVVLVRNLAELVLVLRTP